MSEYPDHDRVTELLRRIEQITKESEELRRKIANIRNARPQWPDRRRRSRVFDEEVGPAGRQTSNK